MAKSETVKQTQNKKALEYIYCIVNERELFSIIKQLIEQSTGTDF